MLGRDLRTWAKFTASFFHRKDKAIHHSGERLMHPWRMTEMAQYTCGTLPRGEARACTSSRSMAMEHLVEALAVAAGGP